jgi:GNAT superfamily N-acetyltransferase
MELRSARAEDIPALARLRWDLYDEGHPVAGESRADYVGRFTTFADEALRSTSWFALVAWEGERVVGAMWVYRVPRVPQPGRGPAAPLAYLTNVFIDPAHRSAGVGSRMLEEVRNRCRDDGFSLIFAWPSDRSFPFYERAGFSRPPDPLVLDLGADWHERSRG